MPDVRDGDRRRLVGERRRRVAGSRTDAGAMSAPRLLVEALGTVPVAARRMELVERKGIGHPDTMCDAMAEAIAVALGRMYVERTGRVLHHNVDKALLVAGQCAKGFGWGKLTQPMELIVGDRATMCIHGEPLPVEDTVRAAVDAWLAAHLPRVRAGRDLVVRPALAAGSAELTAIFDGDRDGVVANDTSAVSGYAPLTPTEALVLEAERFLNGVEFKAVFGDTGQDVKVLAVREDDRVSMTVAMPWLAEATPSESGYFRRKEEALDALRMRFRDVPLAVAWALNMLDRPGRGADGCYLTWTGTSAEDGDSGQVGRGNGVNGLTALARPSGAEAAAGKNAIAHPGKIHGVLSHRLAAEIHARCPGLREVSVHLAARIGEPVDRPWTGVQVVLAPGIALADVEPAIRDIVHATLADLPRFRAALLRGELSVC
jgi:S-adenosylmethionine synthetase